MPYTGCIVCAGCYDRLEEQSHIFVLCSPQDKFRMEKVKTEVKLLTRNATDDMKKQLTCMIEEDLIKILSDA
jgi:hypothetical protein